MNRYLFLVASARDKASDSNTERLARVAAAQLPAGTAQTWLHLCDMHLEPFTDRRHSAGSYARPKGDLALLLEATLACTDLVLVAPVYWYSFPAALKTYLDHWTGWLHVPGLEFRQAMSTKTMHLVSTAGDTAKAQPMVDTARLCAAYFPMRFAGALVGAGGAPGAIDADRAALAEAARFFGGAAGRPPGTER
jgi:multimeric flavodoxin WrbA